MTIAQKVVPTVRREVVGLFFVFLHQVHIVQDHLWSETPEIQEPCPPPEPHFRHCLNDNMKEYILSGKKSPMIRYSNMSKVRVGQSNKPAARGKYLLYQSRIFRGCHHVL